MGLDGGAVGGDEGSAMRILVIDDNRSLRESAARLLELLGSDEVTTASCGEEGLALAGDGDFDVVLCDLEMPGISGLEVWRRLSDRMKTRFVMWTGAPEQVEDVKFPVLTKPVPAAELREALRRMGR